ncbi:MAG: hypothetical protein M3Y41_01885 [Pseudomonadota bacterium]|nr:hypothetical protein [Pseudomonadota bacterium]
MALDVVSDGLIAAAYYSIPIALTLFLVRRRDVAFRSIFWAFAIFILACGTTHVFDVIVLWRPFYWTQGIIKAFTAAVSVLTAIRIWPLIPGAVAMPGPSQLREANLRLQEQVEQRDAAVAALKRETVERLPPRPCCGSRRRWKRWVSSPAAWPTISTIS